MELKGAFTQGFLKENALYRQLLGLCPALAVTQTAINSLGMGLATLFVLVAANLVISSCKNVIPSKVRIPAFIVIIATFVTLVQMFLEAFTPDLHAALGIFLPLIVTNCLILGRAEAFASKNRVTHALGDALGMGLGFTIGLVSLGIIRELLAHGSIFGLPIVHQMFEAVGLQYYPVQIFVNPAGAFIAFGLLLAVFNVIYKRVYEAPKKTQCDVSESQQASMQ